MLQIRTSRKAWLSTVAGVLATTGVAAVLSFGTANASTGPDSRTFAEEGGGQPAEGAELPTITIDGSRTPAEVNSVQVFACAAGKKTKAECTGQWLPQCVTNLPHDGSPTDTGRKASFGAANLSGTAFFETYASADCTGAKFAGRSLTMPGDTAATWLIPLDSL
jgi:hypothetical protein